MESIKELREICQSTRPSIFGDFLNRFYYRVSIYFTWLCLKCGLSANQVTVLSGLVAFSGGVLLSFDSLFLNLLGACCFHLFSILDMSDGEVARYRNQGGVTGHYLDWFMHYVSSFSFVFGLFLASYYKLNNPFWMGLAAIALAVPLLSKSIQSSGWTVISWTRLRDIKKGVEAKGRYGTHLKNERDKKPSFLKRRMIFLLSSPLQDHWVKVIIFFAILLDQIQKSLGLLYIDYKFWWLIYFSTVGLMWVFIDVKRLIHSQALHHGYERLFACEREIIFPQDDFL